MRAPHIAILKLGRWPRGCMELQNDWGVIRQSWRRDSGESEVKGLIPQVVDEYTVKLTPNGFVCPSEESTRAG